MATVTLPPTQHDIFFRNLSPFIETGWIQCQPRQNIYLFFSMSLKKLSLIPNAHGEKSWECCDYNRNNQDNIQVKLSFFLCNTVFFHSEVLLRLLISLKLVRRNFLHRNLSYGRSHLFTILSLPFTLLSKHLKEHFAIFIYVINFQIWIKGRSKKDTHISYVLMSSPLSYSTFTFSDKFPFRESMSWK